MIMCIRLDIVQALDGQTDGVAITISRSACISRLPRDEIETPDTAEILISQRFNTTAFQFNIYWLISTEMGK